MKDKYKLDIISQHHQFKDQALIKHYIDGIDTIGVYGEEPFQILFTNLNQIPVQVKISLDGTDILTGEKASAKPIGNMWYVAAGEKLKLSAWPETNEGGAQFIFGQTSNSVAAHTHGDMSHKGIISVAVFTEAYAPPRTVYNRRTAFDRSEPNPIRLRSLINHSKSDESLYVNPAAASFSKDRMREISDTPAVGAGEAVMQKIANVQGFIQPRFEQIVSMRYIWWDDLKTKLEKVETAQHPTGFVDAPTVEHLINLGRTPRIISRVDTARAAYIK